MAIATINPATGVTEAEFAPHDAAETERRIAQAHAAAAALRLTDYATRAGWMRASADILEAELDDVARMLTVEMGKPIAQSRGEVLKCAKNMRFYAERAEAFLADEPLADPASVGASRACTRYEPLGVVLAVMPWNYPLWQVIRFAAPALMAGNTGVLKHASNVPQAALYLDTLFERGGFPAGSFRTLLIGSARGRRRHRRRPREGGHPDRVGAGRPLGRRDRRQPHQEGRARARRFRPVHRPGQRGHREGRRDGGHRPDQQQRAVLHRRQALHRPHRRLRPVRRRVQRADGRARRRRPAR